MEANLGTITSLCRWVVGPQAGGQGCLGPRARTGRPRVGEQELSVVFSEGSPRRGVGDWAGQPGHGPTWQHLTSVWFTRRLQSVSSRSLTLAPEAGRS